MQKLKINLIKGESKMEIQVFTMNENAIYTFYTDKVQFDNSK